MTGSATQCFLSELQKIAKLSGRSFEDILQEQLSECNKSVAVETEPISEPSTAVPQSPPTKSSASEPEVTYPAHPERTTELVEAPLSNIPSHTKGGETP